MFLLDSYAEAYIRQQELQKLAPKFKVTSPLRKYTDFVTLYQMFCFKLGKEPYTEDEITDIRNEQLRWDKEVGGVIEYILRHQKWNKLRQEIINHYNQFSHPYVLQAKVKDPISLDKILVEVPSMDFLSLDVTTKQAYKRGDMVGLSFKPVKSLDSKLDYHVVDLR